VFSIVERRKKNQRRRGKERKKTGTRTIAIQQPLQNSRGGLSVSSVGEEQKPPSNYVTDREHAIKDDRMKKKKFGRRSSEEDSSLREVARSAQPKKGGRERTGRLASDAKNKGSKGNGDER